MGGCVSAPKQAILKERGVVKAPAPLKNAEGEALVAQDNTYVDQGLNKQDPQAKEETVEPMIQEPEPELVAAEPEPEPELVAAEPEPEPEPELVAAEPEPEPEVVAAEPETQTETEEPEKEEVKVEQPIAEEEANTEQPKAEDKTEATLLTL